MHAGPGAWPRIRISGGNVVKGSGAYPDRHVERRDHYARRDSSDLFAPTIKRVESEVRSLGPTASAEVRAGIALRNGSR